jgi:hypothetical protein
LWRKGFLYLKIGKNAMLIDKTRKKTKNIRVYHLKELKLHQNTYK